MLTARSREETIGEVPGIRFRTNALPKTESERQLQEIQSKLSDRKADLPAPPHLNFFNAAIVDGPDQVYISLWVPTEQRSQAIELLAAAGFAVD